MFYKIKTYQKVDENKNTLTYMDASEKDGPVFDNLKLLLIEASKREKENQDENTLTRLVTCDENGVETENKEGCISFNGGDKEIVLLG